MCLCHTACQSGWWPRMQAMVEMTRMKALTAPTALFFRAFFLCACVLAAKQALKMCLCNTAQRGWGRRPWWKCPGRRHWLHLQFSSSKFHAFFQCACVLAAKQALKMCLCNAAQRGWGRRPWWKCPGQRRWLPLQLASSMPSSSLLAVLATRQTLEVLLSCRSSQQPCAQGPVCIAAQP